MGVRSASSFLTIDRALRGLGWLWLRAREGVVAADEGGVGWCVVGEGVVGAQAQLGQSEFRILVLDAE